MPWGSKEPSHIILGQKQEVIQKTHAMNVSPLFIQ